MPASLFPDVLDDLRRHDVVRRARRGLPEGRIATDGEPTLEGVQTGLRALLVVVEELLAESARARSDLAALEAALLQHGGPTVVEAVHAAQRAADAQRAANVVAQGGDRLCEDCLVRPVGRGYGSPARKTHRRFCAVCRSRRAQEIGTRNWRAQQERQENVR